MLFGVSEVGREFMSDRLESQIGLADIRSAADRILGKVVRTPLIPVAMPGSRRPLWVKPESFQPTGAFKLRGAYNAILQRLEDARRFGVTAHSSGNHARAVAWVARELGLTATLVMPDAAPRAKVEAVRALGAEVLIVPSEDRDLAAVRLAEEHGYVHVPPYDDAMVVAGQGTVGLEILEDMSHPAVVLVPISGGGLIAGIATAVKEISPNTAVVGVEPELAADAEESFRVGHRVEWRVADTYRTIADGLRTTSVGAVPWKQICRYVDDIVTVSDMEICAAVQFLATSAGLVAEASGAVATAGYLYRGSQLPMEGPSVVVLSGGNISCASYSALLSD